MTIEIDWKFGISFISFHGLVIHEDAEFWGVDYRKQQQILREARNQIKYLNDIERLDKLSRSRNYHKIILSDDSMVVALNRAKSNPFLEDKEKVKYLTMLEDHHTELEKQKLKRHPSGTLRDQVIERDCGLCQYCGQEPEKIYIDHVIPYSLGGLTEYNNLVVSCFGCNARKGGRHPADWMSEDKLEEIKRVLNVTSFVVAT